MDLKGQYFDERFTATTIKHPELPFFHSCDAIYLQAILTSGELKPRPCKVYGEDLLYLFYGKPAYKSGELTNSTLNHMMPLCFIINNNAVTTIKRIIPFDSGAFDGYSDHLHKSMTREEFQLTPSKEAINKTVDYFFAGNDLYFNGVAKKEIIFDPIHFQIESYHSIITNGSKSNVDDRKASLEVQLDYSIAVNKSNIEAVILPKSLALSPTIKDVLIDSLGIDVIPITNYGVAAKDYYVHVLEKTKNYLIGKKLLNGT